MAHCSWCDKSQAEVQVLIEGTRGAYICNECVELCVELVREREPVRSTSPRGPISHGMPVSVQAALARLRAPQTDDSPGAGPPHLPR